MQGVDVEIRLQKFSSKRFSSFCSSMTIRIIRIIYRRYVTVDNNNNNIFFYFSSTLLIKILSRRKQQLESRPLSIIGTAR